MSAHTLQMTLLGERIAIGAGDPTVIDAVRDAASLLVDASPPGEPPDLAYEFHARDAGGGDPLPEGKPLGVSAHDDFETFARSDGVTVVVEGKSVARCDLAGGKVSVEIHPDHEKSPWVIGHRLFLLPLLEWMRYRGWYPIHGSCFLVDGRAVLVSGPSGSGKSTAVLSALAAGCPIVSDDTLFAYRHGRSICLEAFPEPIKIGRGSAKFFPEWSRKLSAGMGKLILGEDQLPGGARVSEATPELLLFPEIAASGKSGLKPISKEESLVLLLPQSAMPAEYEIMQRHIDLLGELVEQVQSYRLRFGEDARELPAQIRELL